MTKRELTLTSIFFIFLTGIFFYKVFQNFLPIPGDLLIGGYFPWLDYKWGYEVGVPVKNPALSDVISYAYPLRNLVVELIKGGNMPFWNPFIFSGIPLLADWQAATFYPLNIFMILLGSLEGWTIMIILQPLFSMFFMFGLLRTFKISTLGSVFGAFIFAFSAYMLIFLEFTYLQGGIWLPLLILAIEKYINEKKQIWATLTSITIFFILSAGNFQISLFSLIISISFFIFRSNQLNLSKSLFIKFFIFYILGVGLIAIQLIPTIELFLNSIRSLDSNIVHQNFGLIPLKDIVRLLAPDFFGNPATHNSTAFLYHETSGYFGIIPLIFVIYAVIKEKSFIGFFFTIVFLVSLLLLFDTPFGKIPFDLKIPLISTSYASRILYLLTFSAAILAALGMDRLKKIDKNLLKINLVIFAVLIGICLGLSLVKQLSTYYPASIDISLRNLILPILIASFSLVILKTNLKLKIISSLLILITIFDLFRFGWKYNPFVSKDLIYPKTPSINFLTDNSNSFRIEREKSEVFPPNTWMAYGLTSPSGYNPLALRNYAQFYNIYTGNSPEDGVSRYLELGNYSAPLLDLLGVKYLVVAKRENNKITKDTGNISSNISSPKLKKVFEDKSLVVLENTQVLPRVILYDQYDISKKYFVALEKIYKGYDFRRRIILDQEIEHKSPKLDIVDRAEILSYKANEVIIETNIKNSAILMLTDTYYPGWKVSINNAESKILLADGIFKAVSVPRGTSIVKFNFEPRSFYIGLGISLFSLILIIILTAANLYGKK